jgi:hypothetical protein
MLVFGLVLIAVLHPWCQVIMAEDDPDVVVLEDLLDEIPQFGTIEDIDKEEEDKEVVGASVCRLSVYLSCLSLIFDIFTPSVKYCQF